MKLVSPVFARLLFAATLAALALGGPVRADGAFIHRVNIIDGADERDSLLALGPTLGLSADEIARIRAVSGFVGCFHPTPSIGSGALFLTNRHILTAAHIFYTPDGRPRTDCFFKNQAANPYSVPVLTGPGFSEFGAVPPRAGSNQDYAVATLAGPVPGAVPFPVDQQARIKSGDQLIVITAHPAGMAREMDPRVPVAQGCVVRRVPVSTEATNFYRTDCDASGSSSGGMHLSRVGGELVFRGFTITTGPWRDKRFHGAPYDEKGGSVTTALGTDAAVLAAGQRLAGE